MKTISRFILILFFFTLTKINEIPAQTIRIMPLGNSITYDDNMSDKNNPRPAGQRPGYRLKLYNLLTDAGYDFDFVGSENSGGDYFDDSQNAGFPGIKDHQLAYLINTGYNQEKSRQEAPGPYLLYYPADIILLHIGTNDLDTDPGDVEDILDNIRSYDSDVLILLARIINRNPYDSQTTTFNNNVETMVNNRGDDRIIMVDMENGAGINYSTDMNDYLHPNPQGYEKMGAKWFEALENINPNAPQVDIPNQTVNEGGSFNSIYLDEHVSDVEDQANQLSWTYTPNPATNLNISINSNRVVSISLKDPDWSGSETITFKATDTGSGGFKKSGSDEVTFFVDAVNDAPVITGHQDVTINEEASYTISLDDLTWSDEDNGPEDITVIVSPGNNYIVDGTTITPNANYYGELSVPVKISDSELESNTEIITVQVNNVNDPPIITNQIDLSTDDETPLEIVKSYLTIEDIDNPLTDISIEVLSGNDYTKNGNIIYPDDGFNGTLNVNVKALDLDSESDVFQVAIEVTLAHNPPFFTSVPEDTAYEDESYLYVITVSDPDSEEDLEITAIDIPSWLSFNGSAGLLGGTPKNEHVGQYNITLRLSDGFFNVDQNFTLKVINTNDPPEFTSYPLLIADDYEEYSCQFEATDADGDSLSYLAVNIPGWLQFNEETKTLSGIPSWNHANNSYPVSISAYDGTETIYQNFNIYVYNENDKPIITSKADSVAKEDELYLYMITAEDIDEDDNLSVRLVQPGPDWLTVNETAWSLMGTPQDADAGINNVSIIVSDGRSSVYQHFSIMVENVNDPPVVISEPDTIINEDMTYFYSFKVTDEDVDDEISFVTAELPDWLYTIKYSDSLLVYGKPGYHNVGRHNVSLIATDGITYVEQTFKVRVDAVPHEPEIITIPRETWTEDELYTYSFEAIDKDDDHLTYAASKIPDWLQFAPNTGVLIGTPSDENTGNNEVILEVTDGTFTVTQKFNIFVENVNDKPIIIDFDTIETIMDKSVKIGLNNIHVEDPDNTYPDDFTLTILDGENYTKSGFSITPASGYTGQLAVRVKVNDGELDSDESNIIVIVDSSTSIKTPMENQHIINKIYPVPANELVHIELNIYTNNCMLELYDMTGKRINEYMLIKGQKEFRIVTTDFKEGIYGFSIYNKDFYQNGKFIVLK